MTAQSIVAIDHNQFGDVIHKDYGAWDMSRGYAVGFLKKLNNTARGKLSDLVHHEFMHELVCEIKRDNVGNTGIKFSFTGGRTSVVSKMSEASRTSRSSRTSSRSRMSF